LSYTRARGSPNTARRRPQPASGVASAPGKRPLFPGFRARSGLNSGRIAAYIDVSTTNERR